MLSKSHAVSPQKNDQRYVLTPSAGCQRIIRSSVHHLQQLSPFNDSSTQEGMALLRFEFDVNQKLSKMIHEDKPLKVTAITSMYQEQVTTLTKKLHQQELKNQVHAVFMITAGVLMSLLAALPLGLPLFFSPVRHYIGSFFHIPTPAAQTFESQIQASISALNHLLLGSVTCYGDVNHEDYLLVQNDPEHDDLVDAMSGYMLEL